MAVSRNMGFSTVIRHRKSIAAGLAVVLVAACLSVGAGASGHGPFPGRRARRERRPDRSSRRSGSGPVHRRPARARAGLRGAAQAETLADEHDGTCSTLQRGAVRLQREMSEADA